MLPWPRDLGFILPWGVYSSQPASAHSCHPLSRAPTTKIAINTALFGLGHDSASVSGLSETDAGSETAFIPNSVAFSFLLLDFRGYHVGIGKSASSMVAFFEVNQKEALYRGNWPDELQGSRGLLLDAKLLSKERRVLHPI